MLTITPRLFVWDVTEFADFGCDADKIKKIEDVFLYDANYVVHMAELQGSHWCVYLYTTIEFIDGIANDERETLHDKYAYDVAEDCYVHTNSIKPAVVLEDETFEDMDYDEAFEEVLEYYRCNTYY